MAAMSNYLENQVIDWLLRAQTFTPPATVYVALYTTAPTAAGGGTEVSGSNYSRVAVTSSLANWAGTQSAGSTTPSSGTSGQTSNNGAIVFPTPSGSWGTVVAVGLLDASTSGNLLYFGNLTSSQIVGSGATVTFAPAALTLTLS